MRCQSVSSARAGARVAGGDRGLERIGPRAAAERLGARQRRQPAADQQLVPRRAVLLEQQHRLAVRAGARARSATPGSPSAPRGRAPPARRARARPGCGRAAAPPRRAAGRIQSSPARRRIALVEDQVDHLQHRRQAAGALGATRHFERHAGLGERALGAHDALRDGRLRHQEGAGDLVGGEPAEQPQRQRDARLRRQDGWQR